MLKYTLINFIIDENFLMIFLFRSELGDLKSLNLHVGLLRVKSQASDVVP